jgi:hypothetical protein
MTNQSNFTAGPIDKTSLAKHLIIGLVIGFAVISFFVFGVDYVKPEWGEYWRIRPLIITPLAGAAGGAVFYFMDYIGKQRGWSKAGIIAMSTVVAFVGLFIGVVLGLDGTMWD